MATDDRETQQPPLRDALLGEARTILDAVSTQLEASAASTARSSADEVSTASALLRRVPRDSAQYEAIFAARAASKAAAAEASDLTGAHREMVRALFDDLERFAR
jgi:hypothetical protein